MPDVVTCPACEGWGQIMDSKTSTITCACCKGEGVLEVAENDAPGPVFAVCLALLAILLVVLFLLAPDSALGTP